MLILHTSPDHNVDKLINLIQESSCDFTINSFKNWQTQKPTITPRGFIYIHVSMDLAVKRVSFFNKNLVSENIASLCLDNENYFLQKTTMPSQFQHVPLLVLNGNIHINHDFSQFYTHLFSIKKFFESIKVAEDAAQGIYKVRRKHSGCKC
jgi:hypothetical protein